MKKLVHAILAILLLVPVTGLPQVDLAGTVKDKTDGHTLPGAHVTLENTFLTAVTGPDGGFRFHDLKRGNYTLKASYIGYQAQEISLALTKDTVVAFVLPAAPILGEEVNIEATRAGNKYPTAFSTLTSKEIERVNLGRDLPYLLQSTPSVVTTSDAGNGIGYTGINIRGTDLTRINVTVNGIPLNDAESQGVWFVDLPDIASSTRDIQIQRGVGTSTNGAGAFGATINIQTAGLNPDPYGQLSLSGGTFGSFKGTVNFGTGLIGKNFAIDGRASWLTSQGYIDRASSNLKSFFLSAGYYGPHTTLRLITFSGLEKTYQAWEGVPGDSLATNRTFNPAGMYYDTAGNIHYYPNQTDNYLQNHYQAIFSQQLAMGWNLNVALHLTTGEGYYENYKEDAPFENYGLHNVTLGDTTLYQTDLVNRKYLENYFYGITFSSNYHVKNIRLTLGGAWNDYHGDHFGRVIWAQYASNSDNQYKYYDNNGDKTDFNIYLKTTWALYKKWNLFADLQYRNVVYDINGTLDNLQRQVDEQHAFSFFNPKAGVYYDISDGHHAFFSFGIGNREPSRNNYVDADPGQEPKPERLYDYELGYNYTTKKFQASANLYYMQYYDQLVLTGKINNVGEAVMVNVPHSYRMGIELSFSWNILRNLQWTLNATLSDNKIRDFTEYIDTYDAGWNFTGQESIYLGKTDLSFSPDLTAGNIIRYEPLKDFVLTLYSKYVGKQYFDNTSTESRSLDPWFVNNLSAEYTVKTRFVREIGLTLMVNNLLNARYETNAWVYPYLLAGDLYELNGYFPQAGINFMAGITLRL